MHELFPFLPDSLTLDIYGFNPWWRDRPGKPLPPYRRWLFGTIKQRLFCGIAPVVVLRGPRRVGKTVLLRQIIEDFMQEGVRPQRILYVPFDELPAYRTVEEPILRIADWFEEHVLGQDFNAAAKAGEPAFLFFDEVQNLKDWAPQVKSLVDNREVRVLLTGSSSLRIEAGTDSLAGRITTFELGTLLLREVAGIRFGENVAPCMPENGLDCFRERDFWEEVRTRGQKEQEIRRRAFRAFSARGGYPVVHEHPDVPWPEVADQLVESVIQRTIRHDLRMGERGKRRDERLLEEVFRLACRYAGQAPGKNAFLEELRQVLAANVGWQRVLSYLRFLDGALLLRLIPPMEIRLKRRKSPEKVVLCDHGLRAAWLQEIVPLAPEELEKEAHLTDLAGRIAESVLGYFLVSIPHLNVAYFPARGREPEIDFVITIGTRRIPIEVKYRRRIDGKDLHNLQAFLDKKVYNAPFGVLVTLEDEVEIVDPRIVPLSLSTFLWLK